MTDCVVRNEKAKIVTVAPLEMAFRFLKQSCPDGEYSVEGPKTNCTVIRKNGIVYPSSGTILGVPIDPRNLDECRKLFQEPAEDVIDDDYDDE